MPTTKNQEKMIEKNFSNENKTALQKDRAITPFVIIIGGIIALSIPLFVLILSNQVNKRINSNKQLVSTSPKLPNSVVVTPQPTPSPSPVPLVQGPQTYSIGTKQTPMPYQVYFNTIDPHSSTQTVELSVKDISSISTVTAVVATDKSKNTYPLTLKSGTKNDGVWTGSWTINDTYNKNLTITFKSSDAAGNKSSVDLTIR